MKSITSILAGSIALALAGSASADVVVNITGSTAYRGATHLAIAKILGGTPQAGYKGSNLNGASKAWFQGTIASHPELGTVTIKTSWSGSAKGVQVVSNASGSIVENFLPTTLTSSTAAANSSGSSVTGGAVVTDADVQEAGDVAMSDTFQNSTPFKSPVLNVDTVVGVVPFKWVVSNPGTGNPAPFNNITPQIAQQLWANGTIPLSVFTGLNADEGVSVFATGRDPDSGTRLTAFAESGIGIGSVVLQYKPTISAGAVTGYNPYPAQTINGIPVPIGEGGESSGGTVATNLTATTDRNVGYSVSYLSTGDAGTAITGGAKELSYNGVTLDPSPFTNLKEGKYTFWGYEHLMYKSSLATDKKTVASTLATQIIGTDATVKLSDMKVQRATDGGLVSPNF